MKKVFKSTATAVTAVSTMSHAVKLSSCKKSKVPSMVNLLEDCMDQAHVTPPHHSAAVGELEALKDAVKTFGLTLSETDANQCTLLHHAAKGNQVAIMTYLIESGINLDAIDADGDTALHTALREGSLEAAHLLLDYGASTTIANKKKDTAFHTAARESSGKSLKAFISHDVDFNVRGHRNRTVLHTIAEEDNLECLKVMHNNSKKKGCGDKKKCSLCLCNKDEDGLTPVHLAAKKNSHQVLEFFISCDQHTAENIVSFIDEENSTPLHSAVDAGHLEVVRVLLKHKACARVVKDNIPPPLHLACSQGRLEMVKVIVEQAGKDILECVDQHGRTALHYSAFSIHSTSIMSYITEEGGQRIGINKQDNKGRTPLHMSISSGNLTGVKELLARGADPFMKDNEENNALHFAVLHNRKAIIEALLETANSDDLANEINKKGFSPIHIALKLGLRDIVTLLISSIQLQAKNVKDSYGNNYIHLAASSGDLNALLSFLDLANAHKLLNETNENGHTPLHSAAKKGHTRCVECLLHSGAMAHKCHKGTSPLMLACREAHIECAKLLYRAYRFQIDWQDIYGDTALHHAARSGSPSMVQQILDFNAEIIINDAGKSFLDEIISSGKENCGLAVVNHRRWQECLDVISPAQGNPMLGLVTYMPTIAKAVLDRCHTKEHSSAMSKETFNFKYLLTSWDNEQESSPPSSKSSTKTQNSEKKEHPVLTRSKTRRKLQTELAATGLDVMDPDFKTMTMQRKRSSSVISAPKQTTGKHSAKKSKTMGVLKRMILCKRADLLTHPVVSAYLKRKWNSYGYIFYLLHFTLLAPFVFSLTMFVLLRPTSTAENATEFGSGNFSSELPDLTTAQKTFRWITIVTCSILSIDAISGLFVQGFKSVNFLDSTLMWNNALTIVTTFVFLAPSNPFTSTFIPFGSAACFFAWLLLFHSLEFFNTTGIYVNMFFTILRTVFKVLFACSFLLMAFAISLFVVAGEVPEFSNAGYSLFSVFGYMLGEIQYSLFIAKANTGMGHNSKSTAVIAIIIIILLAIMLSIVLANLLIGLAVGDIEQIKMNALNHRRALEVAYFTNLDDHVPKCLQHFITPKLYYVKTRCNVQVSKFRRLRNCFVRKVKEEVLDSSDVLQSTDIQSAAALSPSDLAAEMAQMRRKLQEITDMLHVFQEGAGEFRRRQQQHCLRWQKPQSSSMSLNSTSSDFSMSASDFLPDDLA